MKPLEGVRVLDFGRVLAAPLGTQNLAELGATVIKVERPGSGDETRTFEPRVGSESAYFFAFNRGKQSVTLDLKSAEGAAAARRLAATVDVVVENFLPGAMDRLGLGYETLSADNPGLVYVSTTGFGQTGPMRDERGYDTVFQAMAGLVHLTGHPDGPPAKVGVPVADLSSGLWVTIAALTGLVGRARTGQGTRVDLAMLDVQHSLLALAAARLFALDEDPVRTGTDHPGRVPSRSFATADDRWVHISVSDQHWPALCRVLDLDELAADPELSTNAGRLADRDRVIKAIAVAVLDHDRDDAVALLQAAGVPVGPVLDVREALHTDQARARGTVGTFDHPVVGSFPALRTPLRFQGWADPEVLAPPVLGADTDQVLTAAGLTSSDIDALRGRGVV